MYLAFEISREFPDVVKDSAAARELIGDFVGSLMALGFEVDIIVDAESREAMIAAAANS